MKENQPLISIVLPTYNGAKYLQYSIQSCLDQTHTNWELIIVDDCSTDNTPDIIASFEKRDPRIRSMRHDNNRKLPASLNTGFLHAKGDFLTWTSDDNYFDSLALEEMGEFMLSNQDVGLVYTDYSIVDENGIVIRQHQVRDPEMLIIGCVVGPSFLYRRDVLDLIGNYSEHAFLAEDYDYWLRVSMRFELEPLHNNLYYYRDHKNRLAQNRDLIHRSTLSVKEAHFPKLTWADGSLKAIGYMHMIKSAIRLNYYLKVIPYLGHAIRNKPAIVVRYIPKIL